MIVSIAQPAYLPWIGYFHRIALSDVHVVLDHVPISHGDFTNRNKIATSQGWSWLTVPVHSHGEFAGKPIAEILVDNRTSWAKKHWKSLCHAYGRSKHFAEVCAGFEAVYARDWTRLVELCLASTRQFFEPLGIDAAGLRMSSQMDLREKKSDLVLEIAQKVGASTYLSGPLGRDYLDLTAFAQSGIEVRFHDYVHPVYEQFRRAQFEPYMSAIDLLSNAGAQARTIMMSDQPEFVAR